MWFVVALALFAQPNETIADIQVHGNLVTTDDELRQHLQKLLAAYKVPRSIEFRAELPKGPTGKVQRRLLK